MLNTASLQSVYFNVNIIIIFTYLLRCNSDYIEFKIKVEREKEYEREKEP